MATLTTFVIRAGDSIREVTDPAVKSIGIYAPVDFICSVLDRPTDQVMAVLASVLAFILCLPLPWLRASATRKWYVTVWGLVIGFYTYGVSFSLVTLYVTLGWLQIRLLPPKLAPISIITLGSIILTWRTHHEW